MARGALLRVAVAAAIVEGAGAACPFAARIGGGHRHGPHGRGAAAVLEADLAAYSQALVAVDFDAVRADLLGVLTTSQDFWPIANNGNYGPLFVRLAWHCSGSYRTSDGRGGCGGGRQRFDPERSWDDNTNLDKARRLLWPVKQKYGLGLSWGDLFILAGNTAIESMGGPVLGFCGGRVDAVDGADSEKLGPSVPQQAVAPCAVDGTCKEPLGATTIGLIYVNPEGPMSKPIPHLSAGEIRDTFGRMAMNDSETVALIGGGHAFGKTHGACPAGAGSPPKDDPANPWPGKCGSGRGAHAFTSGFEGPWTANPTKWDNDFFKQLLELEWEVHVGPGGKHQWRVRRENATAANSGLMRLTSDIALLHDPKGEYQKLVKEYATDMAEFDNAFKNAWYKMTTRDMGPVTRCFGNDVPPPQPWQNPLPAPPAKLADFSKVRERIIEMLRAQAHAPQTAGAASPTLPLGALFVRLAWQCASTYRSTDYLGGCNGARVRFSPEKDWPANSLLLAQGIDKPVRDLETAALIDVAVSKLQPVKDEFADGLSWADLIVLAGTTAIEKAGGRRMHFCGGRTDASDGSGSEYLKPKVTTSTDSIDILKDSIEILDLSTREVTALNGAGHSLGAAAWSDGAALTNAYFKALLNEEWEAFAEPVTGRKQLKAKGKSLYILPTDFMFAYDSELQAAAQYYAQDESLFLDDLARAWTKLMNADRFDGPGGNLCHRAFRPPPQAPAAAYV